MNLNKDSQVLHHKVLGRHCLFHSGLVRIKSVWSPEFVDQNGTLGKSPTNN